MDPSTISTRHSYSWEYQNIINFNVNLYRQWLAIIIVICELLLDCMINENNYNLFVIVECSLQSELLNTVVRERELLFVVTVNGTQYSYRAQIHNDVLNYLRLSAESVRRLF